VAPAAVRVTRTRYRPGAPVADAAREDAADRGERVRARDEVGRGQPEGREHDADGETSHLASMLRPPSAFEFAEDQVASCRGG